MTNIGDNIYCLIMNAVKKNLPLSVLTNSGYSFAQIGKMFNELEQKKLLLFNDSGASITAGGERMLEEYNRRLDNIQRIIIPLDKYRTKKVGFGKVAYVPNHRLFNLLF